VQFEKEHLNEINALLLFKTLLKILVIYFVTSQLSKLNNL